MARPRKNATVMWRQQTELGLLQAVVHAVHSSSERLGPTQRRRVRCARIRVLRLGKTSHLPNFGAIHDAIIDSLRPLVSGDGTYLEVGCGTGKLDRLRSGDGTVLTDLSGSMLQLARRRTSDGIRCERMDAFSPHFRDGSVRGAFAFLGDAYNHPVFFHRVHQMLVNGGHLVFTIPSHTWATALRSEAADSACRDHFSSP